MSRPLASAAYTQAFKTLNDEQRQAVTTIEGPVLVVAGPGTGKTQILALRVGNILLETDATPENILCLTYTEAGTVAMRRRLLDFIGPEAYRVPIHTFHGFCNSVIQENAPYFNQYRELRQADELEVRMLYKDILDELPTDHILRRQKGDVYYDVRNMAGFFSDMKKEDWNPQEVVEWIEEELEEAKTRDEFLYKQANKRLGKVKGDLNDRIYDKYAADLKKTAAAAELFPVVQERMTANGWYDYQDMILWVLRAFQNDANLLADYQERYQYFLVDEYQDTNGAQNDLLDLLCDYWERPNVFVVGDDDQAIYRFQGANIGNIQHFIDRYAPERIVLKSNYRSSQAVLDAAQVLIEENEERLVRQDPSLTKDLVAANDSVKDLGRKPLVVEYQNAHEESAGILEWIERFQKQGTPLHEIAILYRKHKQVEELVRVMEQRGMPMNLRKKVNILQLPLVHQFLELLEYLAGEFEQPFSQERRLFEILHYPYFDIPALDIARLSMHFKMERRAARESGQTTRKMYWREAITDEATLQKAGISNTEPFTRFGANIDRWIREQHEFTIQVLFEKILHFGNVYRHIFAQNDRFWLLQVIKTFFDFIKDQTAKRPELSLSGFLRIVENMVAEGISIEFHRVIQSEEGVHFITAHSSKGLEFDVVLLIGSTQKVWDKNPRSSKFKYPPQMTGSMTEATVEDNRRLFFVAMTRAKKDLIISYHLRDTEDKETDKCRFLAETQAHPDVTAQHTARTEQSLVEGYLQSLIYGQEREVPLIDHGIIARALEGYTMSVTALNKYLECKLSFYFENILSVPSARNVHMGFGSAVHQALFDLFRKRDGKRFPDVDDFLRYFERAMEHFQSHFTGREFEDRIALGHDHLRGYYEHYRAQWDFPLDFFLEKKIQHVHCAGVPITGVLDKVEVYPEHYVVVDYKTGDPKYAKDKLLGPDEKNELRGGDYWRQIVFYQLLMEADPAFTKPMDRGFMDFIQRNGDNDRYVRHAIVVTPEDREVVKEQLVRSFEGIQNHEFLPGCGKEDCYWCNFIRFADYGSVPPEQDENSGS